MNFTFGAYALGSFFHNCVGVYALGYIHFFDAGIATPSYTAPNSAFVVGDLVKLNCDDLPWRCGDQGIVVDVDTSKDGCIGVDMVGNGSDILRISVEDFDEQSDADDDDSASEDDGENATPVVLAPLDEDK